MFINYSDLPGFQNLFLDYLYEFQNVKNFYDINFRETEDYQLLFNKLESNYKTNSESIIKIIKNQYHELRISKQTEYNIKNLADSKTFVIITGQQLTVFGGPLYTFYKIITAIKLCAQLKEKFDKYNFVPLFWMEADDHDFEEAKSINLISSDNKVSRISYDDGEPPEVNRGSIGNLTFNNGIDNTVDLLKQTLRKTEYTDQILDIVRSFYQTGDTFSKSFRKIIHHFFDEYGLIIFNPQDINVKKLLYPLFIQEIENFQEHTDSIVEVSAELEELYHAQVKVKPINLFMLHNGGRYLIEPVGDEFRLRGKKRKFSKTEIVETVEQSPERFSPNVLLRPICQDFLFSTAFYIAGPSEISYFAQVHPNYKSYSINQSIIYPRSSVTLAENYIDNIIEKYNLNIIDIFNSEKELIANVINSVSDIDIHQLFSENETDITRIFDNIKEKLYSIDNTLIDAANKSLHKIAQSLDTLKMKAEKAQKKKHEILINQLLKAKTNLYPNNNYQERELNFLYYANKHGLDIIKWLFNELSINRFEHQIIRL
ncbi:bacillithiol biosynthesis cysteine-adding enzyme BshC [Bacteroidota bacterium]